MAQLRERLQQLEAELKASQDTAQWTIKQNKNTLLALKQENKELSAEVARRGGSNELQGTRGSASDGEKAVERLERQVHELRRAYDKVAKDKKTALQKIDNLHDSLRDLQKVAGGGGPSPAASVSASAASSAGSLAAAAAGVGPHSAAARELRQLQNRLDKATVKANEAYSIRKTYEQVLEKLRVEEPLLQSRIRALEEQRAHKQAALEAATLQGREAHLAKEAAKTALAALEEEVARGRARRGRVLAEMRDKASTLQQTNRALLQRQFQPLSAQPSKQHLHQGGPGTPKGSAAPTPKAGGSSSLHDSNLLSGELDDLTARDVAVRLCRATGSARVSELLAKLLAQQDSYQGLVAMHSQATAQRVALMQQLEVLRSHREELRGGGKMSTQKQLDAAQAELSEAQARAESAQEALEALLRAWAGVRGGVEHLAGLASHLPLPPGGPPPVPLEDELLGDVLAQIEQRLVGAYKLISSLPKAVDMLEATYAGLVEAAQ